MTDAAFEAPEMGRGHGEAAIAGEPNKPSGVDHSNANLEEGTVKVSY